MKSRAKTFKTSVPRSLTIKDSRFGLRKFPQNAEVPSIFSYNNPGRGQNGEHQV